MHLSDLHLLSGEHESDRIIGSLIAAVGRERVRRGRIDLVIVTGDLFDSGEVDARVAARTFMGLHRDLQRALGPKATPTLIVPGNHDRRRMGLFGPHRDAIFSAIAERAGPDLFVHGARTPFLAAAVPRAFHGQPLDLLAYDSTYLPHGYLSAGGVVRSEDILHGASSFAGDDTTPLVFALHHHLVPTPLTDVGPIEARRLGFFAKLALHRILPRLVSHADREELTMTALGAGTALSTLHELGRAVLVLHGHKHIATARKLEGTRSRHGDVLVVSSGSAGCAQTWTPGLVADAARLWPSFNVLELDEESPLATLSVDQVSFGWKGRSAGTLVHRPLLEAERDGARWRLLPFDPEDRAAPRNEPRLVKNDATVFLRAPTRHGGSRMDGSFHRLVQRHATRRPRRYVETVEGLCGAMLLRGGALSDTPAQFELPLETEDRYEVLGGLGRSLEAMPVTDGQPRGPYESVALLNRYVSDEARLDLRTGPGLDARELFASATDLGTGEERPLRLSHRERDRVVVAMAQCPARTLLKVHWPLQTR
jgi:3',5'-cyclic AMP phosphodiesterase CpdA